MDYHDKPALSSTAINTFKKHGAAQFWAESPLNPNKVNQEPSDALIFGNLCHTSLFEPQEFDNRYFYLPELNLRTKAGRAEKLELIEANKDKQHITPEQATKAKAMMQYIKDCKEVQKYITGGVAEQEFYYQRNGIDCKIKPDYLVDGAMVDYKTVDFKAKYKGATLYDKWNDTVLNNGYHRQAAWYIDGYQRATGKLLKEVIYLVQDKNNHWNIGLFKINTDSLLVGLSENERVITEIEQRLKDNNWCDFDNSQVNDCGVPEWYITNYNGDYEND